MPAHGDRRLDYLPLNDITPATRNPKRHNLAAVRASIARFGFATPALRDERTGRLVAGHGRTEALRAMRDDGEAPPAGIRLDPDGGWLVPVVCGWASRSDTEADAYLVVDNQHPALGGWDDGGLAELLQDLADTDAELLAVTGFTDDDLAELLAAADDQSADSDRDDDVGGFGDDLPDPDTLAVPDVPTDPISRPGDLWLLGRHRLVCGDTTNPDTIRALANGATVTLIHADPPYGMGKEADGVANDNLYRDKLDEFQMKWWRAWLPVFADNGSAYIWGNAPDLWRLWYVGGLACDDLMVRNEIVWDKASAPGMRSAGEHSYVTATERCLFLMRGEQFTGNQNKEDFWDGYEPLRAWLAAERDRVGWTNKDVNSLTGTQMAGHWFTDVQFAPITEKHYRTLQAAASGRAFTKAFQDVFDELLPDRGRAYRQGLTEQMHSRRTFFDNAHDTMRDVWQFGRVAGEERFGHATPKPVTMVERAIKSSSRLHDVIAAPFGGTGPEFIAAEHLGRTCIGAEIEPAYVDVICRRWQEYTGQKPVRGTTGEPVDFTAPR